MQQQKLPWKLQLEKVAPILTPLLLPLLPHPDPLLPDPDVNLLPVVLLVVDLDLLVDKRARTVLAESARVTRTIRMMMLPNLGAKLPNARSSQCHPRSRSRT